MESGIPKLKVYLGHINFMGINQQAGPNKEERIRLQMIEWVV
jgi:hypothetical protein